VLGIAAGDRHGDSEFGLDEHPDGVEGGRGSVVVLGSGADVE